MGIPGRHAANCRWAKPTIEEPKPVWLESNDRPWTCEREGTPRTLESTDLCEDCPHWQSAQVKTEIVKQ
jgi:hypothetical protein